MNELNTTKWKRKREAVLKRDGYIDQIVLRETGQRRPADTVHHIFPRDRYPEYCWEDWNLVSVSAKTHNELHNHFGDELSEKGERLLRYTALLNNIRMSRRVLVVGLPGTGKTTWAKEHLGNGIAYDLDYIASAFRLGKTDYHKGARRMANDLLKGFAQSVSSYADKAIFIRTAPTIYEAEAINPDMVVFCSAIHLPKPFEQREEKEQRLKELREWCIANKISLVDAE